jgi:DNA-binding response OmpR family regulator
MARPAETLPVSALRQTNVEAHPDRPLLEQDTAPLVLVVGHGADESELVRAACRMGAVTLVAPDLGTARAWLGSTIEETRQPLPAERAIVLGELVIDLPSHQARWRGKPVGLTARELRLLAALVERPESAWSFDDLAEAVWGSSHHGDRSMVRSAIQRLRWKLNAAGAGIEVLAIRGFGFRIVHSSSRHLRPEHKDGRRPRGASGPNSTLHPLRPTPPHRDRNR